jgi:hypothetical protein
MCIYSIFYVSLRFPLTFNIFIVYSRGRKWPLWLRRLAKTARIDGTKTSTNSQAGPGVPTEVHGPLRSATAD